MRALPLRKGKKEVDRREEREEEGFCRTNVKVLPTPLQWTGSNKVRSVLRDPLLIL